MESRKILKNKILKIEELIDEAYELVDIGNIKKVYYEVNLKLNDIIIMIYDIRSLLRGKVI